MSLCYANVSTQEEITPETALYTPHDWALTARFKNLGLTRQECVVAVLLSKGVSTVDACAQLFVTRNTLKFHIRNIIHKLGFPDRKGLVEMRNCEPCVCE